MGEIKSLRPYRVEACVVSVAQAIRAQQSGADRIEICTRLETSGMTPAVHVVKDLMEKVTIPVRVMIRETEKGYEADDFVLAQMLKSIDQFKEIPLEGFVLGVLKNNCIDKEAMKVIMTHVEPLRITFHKAIDESDDLMKDLQWLNEFPLVDTILSSGRAERALEGKENLRRMKSAFNGDVMAGGKITKDQLEDLHGHLALSWYHGRLIVGALGD